MIKHLYDSFAERYYNSGSIYIYSDPHFGDLDCYKMRFPDRYELAKLQYEQLNRIGDVDEIFVRVLDQMQIDNINKKCTKRDTLIILGDVGDIECVKRLKAGYKVLIMGNHDKGASNYKKVIESTYKIDSEFTEKDSQYNWIIADPTPVGNVYVRISSNNLFDEVYEGTLQIGPKLILSHEPVEYPYCLNIHGHIHNVNPLGAYTEGINCTSHYNCCAEQLNYKPVCLKDIINCGGFKNITDIHRKTIDKAVERKSKRSND